MSPQYSFTIYHNILMGWEWTPWVAKIDEAQFLAPTTPTKSFRGFHAANKKKENLNDNGLL
jgi:hypothetical protein